MPPHHTTHPPPTHLPPQLACALQRGSTRIYIPRSLSQVFGRTWVSVGRSECGEWDDGNAAGLAELAARVTNMSCCCACCACCCWCCILPKREWGPFPRCAADFVKSPWSHGGAFITFRGTGQKSRNERTLLTTISADMAAHSRRIPVGGGWGWGVDAGHRRDKVCFKKFAGHIHLARSSNGQQAAGRQCAWACRAPLPNHATPPRPAPPATPHRWQAAPQFRSAR